MRLTGHRCKCSACGEYFSRTSVFDKHRAGDARSRRCLSATEMEAKGMVKLEKGYWIGAPGVVLAHQTGAIVPHPLPNL